MRAHTNRRQFFHQAFQGCLATAATVSITASTKPVLAETTTHAPFPANLKISLNAYSFSKVLNNHNKDESSGISLFQLLEFCGQHGFEGFDPATRTSPAAASVAGTAFALSADLFPRLVAPRQAPQPEIGQ